MSKTLNIKLDAKSFASLEKSQERYGESYTSTIKRAIARQSFLMSK